MNIELLLSNKKRTKILRHVIYSTGRISVNKVAKELKLSKGMASKYLNFLRKEGILKRSGGKFEARDVIPTKAVKMLLNLSLFDEGFFEKYKFVKSAGLYGSFAKGTNTENSDIDMWLLVDKTHEENLAALTGKIKIFGNVKPLYLTKEKIAVLKKEDLVFYHSLVFGSIILYGDGLESV